MGACSSAVSGMGVSSGTSPSCADALASIVGQQKFSAQIIPIWLRHRFTRRRVSPIGVYTIKENALAHAPSEVDGIDDALIQAIVDRHMAMIPTLKLFSGSNHIERIREIVARFHAVGGTLLFGTDTGFLTDYDVNEEYRQLELSGLYLLYVWGILSPSSAVNFKDS